MKHLRRSTRLVCALLLLSCALPGAAGPRVDDPSLLQPEERGAMEGKTVVIAMHRPPAHARFDDGAFWRGGLLGPVNGLQHARAEGRAAVQEFGSVDPTPVARTLLTDLLRDAYGMRPVTFDGRVDLNNKPKYFVARYPEADYVLSVSTGSTLHGEWLTGKGGRAGIGMTLQLINVATQHTVTYLSCREMTKERDSDPSLAELESNNGQRIKDVLKVLAANCARKFAQRLGATDDKLAAFPKWNPDPFAPSSPPEPQATTSAAAQ